MSVRPGDNIGEAINLAEDDLGELYPDARITVVVVAKIEQPGEDTIYELGGAGDTTPEEAEEIVENAGEATRGSRLLRKIQRAQALAEAGEANRQ